MLVFLSENVGWLKKHIQGARKVFSGGGSLQSWEALHGKVPTSPAGNVSKSLGTVLYTLVLYFLRYQYNTKTKWELPLLSLLVILLCYMAGPEWAGAICNVDHHCYSAELCCCVDLQMERV